MREQTPTPEFLAAFARPTWVVMIVAQMLLGLALAIALIMKYYMLVFGTAVCTVEDASVANMVRCTPTLVMLAHFLIAVAAFRFAAVMFVDRPLALVPPFAVGLMGLFLLFLAGIGNTDVSWALAAVILALLACVTIAMGALYYLANPKLRE